MVDQRPLRILRIIARLNVGGPARHVILLTEKFRARGWVSELVVGEVDKNEGSMEEFANSRSVQPIKFAELGRNLNPLYDLLILWRLIRLMFKMKPDIIHTHTAKAGGVGRIAAFLYRRLHWRGLWAPRPLQVYHTFHGHVLQGYFSPVKERIFRLIERVLALVSTRLITLSPSLRSELADLGVAPHEKVSVVPLGIELDSFLERQEGVSGQSLFRMELGLSEGLPLVGIVGRLVPIKDHATFLDAASIVVRKEGDKRSELTHFVIVGDGELRWNLEERAQALGIAERCHFVGWRSDLPEIYESLDLVVLTSRNEGTPLCLIEGMAAARPVVATCVGGVPDLLLNPEENKTSPAPPEEGFQEIPVGTLVRAGDIVGLAKAMAHLIDDPELSIRAGRAGRERIRLYSIDRLVDDLEVLYLKDHEG